MRAEIERRVAERIAAVEELVEMHVDDLDADVREALAEDQATHWTAAVDAVARDIVEPTADAPPESAP